MNSNTTRLLLRLAGFSAGVLIALIIYHPWLENSIPHRTADIVLAISAGFLGVVVAEIARKFIPDQSQLEADEERHLTEAEIIALTTRRRYIRMGAFIFGFFVPLIVYPMDDFASWIFVAIGMCIYVGLMMWFIAEIYISVNPKQIILTRILRKRKSA